MRYLTIVVLLLCATFSARAEIVEIDNATLAILVGSGVPVVDVRTNSEWQETGVVSGSHLLSFYKENGQSDPAAWMSKFRTLVPPNTPVAIICRSGRRSAAVSQFLVQQGNYAKVYNVSGGINGWAAERRPLVPAVQMDTNAAGQKTVDAFGRIAGVLLVMKTLMASVNSNNSGLSPGLNQLH